MELFNYTTLAHSQVCVDCLTRQATAFVGFPHPNFPHLRVLKTPPDNRMLEYYGSNWKCLSINHLPVLIVSGVGG